jgi:acyl-CoA thioester hydrolase
VSPFVHTLRVRYGECDPQGIVFNANYLLYFDVAFTEMWRAAVGPWQEMVEGGYDAVVGEAHLDFRSPARFDDVLDLSVLVVRLGSTAMTTRIDIARGPEPLLSGWLRHVVVSTATWSKTEIPPFIRDGLRRFAAPDAERADEGRAPSPDTGR